MPIERVEAFAAQGVTRIIGGATATDPERQREELTRSPSGSLHVTTTAGWRRRRSTGFQHPAAWSVVPGGSTQSGDGGVGDVGRS
jgi:hypothetical protein